MLKLFIILTTMVVCMHQQDEHLDGSSFSTRQCPPCLEGRYVEKPPHQILSAIHVRRDMLRCCVHRRHAAALGRWLASALGGPLAWPNWQDSRSMAHSNLVATYLSCGHVFFCAFCLCGISAINGGNTQASNVVALSLKRLDTQKVQLIIGAICVFRPARVFFRDFFFCPTASHVFPLSLLAVGE